MTFVLKLAEEELYQNYKEKALHNDSDEDADSRGPKPDNGIVVQYRPIRTSWSQLSVVRLNTLYFPSSLSIQDTNRNTHSMHLWLCLRSSGMLELPGMLSYPVWLQSIPILPLPLPPFLLFVGSTGAFSSWSWVGREGDSRPDPQEALLGLVPASWTAPHTRHTEDMLKILPPKRNAVAPALHNKVKDWNGRITDGMGSK